MNDYYIMRLRESKRGVTWTYWQGPLPYEEAERRAALAGRYRFPGLLKGDVLLVMKLISKWIAG